MKKPDIILFYNTMFDMPLSYTARDIPENFMMTTDRRFMRDAVAVVFHLPSLYPIIMNKIGRRLPVLYPLFFKSRRLMKNKRQLWVAWFMECEVHYPHMSCRSFMESFDLTMSYHLDADIVAPYFHDGLRKLLRRPVPEKNNQNNTCAFISSPLNKSGRLEYLKIMMQFLDIHSYGRVLQNKALGNDRGRESKMDVIAGYKFAIAFENAIAKDYVTEKFYDPLIAGSVPIYLGAPNIEDFAPGEKCFINVADWNDPEALAKHILKISKDEDLYQSYFRWRSEPFRPAFEKLLQKHKKHPFTVLCEKIRERQ